MTLWCCSKCAPDVTCLVDSNDGTVPLFCTAGEYSQDAGEHVCEFRQVQERKGYTGIPKGTTTLIGVN